MTEKKDLGEVDFESQEERSEDDCHDCEIQKQNSELPFANILDIRIIWYGYIVKMISKAKQKSSYSLETTGTVQWWCAVIRGSAPVFSLVSGTVSVLLGNTGWGIT